MRSAPRCSALLSASFLAVSLAACGGYNSMFPRREDIFKPIPVELGATRVQGSDTSYVLGGRGYQLVVDDRALLPDAKTTLERIGSSWRQYFAADPATLTVVLRSPAERGERADSTPRAPAAPGAVVLVASRRFEEGDPREAMNARLLEGRVALPVARAWLAALANGGTPSTDTTAAASWRPPRDPRIPDWIESAVPALVVGAPDVEFVAARLTRERDKLLPLRTLLSGERPATARDSARRDESDDAPRARGRGEVRRQARDEPLSGARLFDAQALAFAEFLADREGRPFVGRVVTAALRGAPDEALREATLLPKDLDGLDRAWRSWLEDQAANAPGRRRAGGR